MTRSMGYGLEAAYGTAVALTDYIDILSFTPDDSNNWNSAHTVGTPMKKNFVPGDFTCGGSFSFDMRGDNYGLLLAGFLGADAIAGAGADYTHTETISSTVCPFTMQFDGDLAATGHKYTSAVIETWSITLDKGGAPVLAECTFKAQSFDLVALSTPTFPTITRFNGHDVDIKVGNVGATASNTYIQSWKIDMKWNLTLDYTPGSREARSCKKEGFEVTGSFDMLFDDNTEIEAFLGTRTSATTPAAKPALSEFDITVDSTVVVGGSTYKFTINVAELQYGKHTKGLDGQNREVATIEWEAQQPSAGEPITFVATNGDTPVYIA